MCARARSSTVEDVLTSKKISVQPPTHNKEQVFFLYYHALIWNPQSCSIPGHLKRKTWQIQVIFYCLSKNSSHARNMFWLSSPTFPSPQILPHPSYHFFLPISSEANNWKHQVRKKVGEQNIACRRQRAKCLYEEGMFKPQPAERVGLVKPSPEGLRAQKLVSLGSLLERCWCVWMSKL